MLLDIVDAGPPVTIDQITRFENKISQKLPKSYVEFLLRCNGGSPHRATFPINGLALNPTGKIHYFFGIGAEFESYDLTKKYEIFQRDIPAGVIVIACTAGSHYICLNLRKEQEKVVYWDQGHFWGTGEWREQDLYEIAPTFEGLIRAMETGAYGPA